MGRRNGWKAEARRRLETLGAPYDASRTITNYAGDVIAVSDYSDLALEASMKLNLSAFARQNGGMDAATLHAAKERLKRIHAASGDPALAFNIDFAVVKVGGSVRVLHETVDEDGRQDFDLMSFDDFKRYTAPQVIRQGDKIIPLADLWIEHPCRRQYDGLVFAPGREIVGFYNLWSGFSIEPAPGDCSLFLQHLRQNVCRGDDSLFRWLWTWFAQMVQQPDRPPGTAVVLRGRQGVGKSLVGEVFGSIMSNHYALIDDVRRLRGHNQHMQRALLLHVDEAIIAGDREAAGKLRSLITSKTQLFEPKFVNAVEVRNYVRVLITGHQHFLIPAGMDERRFAVFEVDNARRGDHEFFASMMQQMEDGGRAALLHDLLTTNLENINLRAVPATAALAEQKLLPLDPVEAWWLERLYDGAQLRGEEWHNMISCDALYDSFLTESERAGVRERGRQTALGITLRRLCPGLRRVRRRFSPDRREPTRLAWFYIFPSLTDARVAFEAALGQTIEWPKDESIHE